MPGRRAENFNFISSFIYRKHQNYDLNNIISGVQRSQVFERAKFVSENEWQIFLNTNNYNIESSSELLSLFLSPLVNEVITNMQPHFGEEARGCSLDEEVGVALVMAHVGLVLRYVNTSSKWPCWPKIFMLTQSINFPVPFTCPGTVNLRSHACTIFWCFHAKFLRS